MRKKRKKYSKQKRYFKRPITYKGFSIISKYNFIAMGVFIVAFLVSLRITKLSSAFSLYYIAINITTFIMFALDKALALHRNMRVPEKTLHLIEFFGGSLSTFFVQSLLRHKTQKESFRFISKLALWFHLIILFFTFKSLIVF